MLVYKEEFENATCFGFLAHIQPTSFWSLVNSALLRSRSSLLFASRTLHSRSCVDVNYSCVHMFSALGLCINIRKCVLSRRAFSVLAQKQKRIAICSSIARTRAGKRNAMVRNLHEYLHAYMHAHRRTNRECLDPQRQEKNKSRFLHMYAYTHVRAYTHHYSRNLLCSVQEYAVWTVSSRISQND
jgi:hypothetical protein